MAERRMFAKTIIDSDAFLDMPLSAQALYFHLNMRADDDGFINNPKKIMRMVASSEDDLKLLFAKNFVIPFESGIVVIKHWKIHNYIQSDRYKPTAYTEEKGMLKTKENKAYTLCIQDGYEMDSQVRLELGKSKDRLDKDSISASDKPKQTTTFRPPTLDEVKAYIDENYFLVDAEKFVDYYTSQGWRLSNGNHMKDWKSAVRNWNRKEKESGKQPAKGYARNAGSGRLPF